MKEIQLKSKCVSYPMFYSPTSIESCLIYIQEIVRIITSKYKPSDLLCFVVTGSSGCMVASAVITQLWSKNFCNTFIQNIRKDNDTSHEGAFVNSLPIDATLIILDDFIDTGATVSRILGQLDDLMVDACFSSGNLNFCLPENLELFKNRIKTLYIGHG